MNEIYWGNFKVRYHPPFAVICHDINRSLSAFYHQPDNLSLSIGWHSATMFRTDTIYTDKGFVRVYLGEVLNGVATGY